MNETLRVVIMNGKYTVIQYDDGSVSALRYGNPWRDCCGDGLILGMAQTIDDQQFQINQMREILSSVGIEEDD